MEVTGVGVGGMEAVAVAVTRAGMVAVVVIRVVGAGMDAVEVTKVEAVGATRMEGLEAVEGKSAFHSVSCTKYKIYFAYLWVHCIYLFCVVSSVSLLSGFEKYVACTCNRILSRICLSTISS